MQWISCVCYSKDRNRRSKPETIQNIFFLFRPKRNSKLFFEIENDLVSYGSLFIWSETPDTFSFLQPPSPTNRINRIKLEFAESEIFQYFDVFLSSVRSSRVKKHRNIEKFRFGSIELIRLNSSRLDSFRLSSKVVEFHCLF